jgi:methylmalonyl-CoA mutase
MSILADVHRSIDKFDRSVEEQVKRARVDKRFAADLLRKWRAAQKQIATNRTPTGITLLQLALPATDEPSQIARYVYGQGLPGRFPFVNSAYPNMYLDHGDPREEPTRLFAGLGLAEDTNARFHYLTKHQRTVRLSTAFDGPTLYGMDSDEPGVFGKIGEGGVAIDTVDDMQRLYDGFPLDDEHFSASMTINGPAPILLAMYIAAARRRFGDGVVKKLRGTVQADILKEVQAQNEVLFPLDASLRFLLDMIDFTTAKMPRWYPISISGYHIAEAGATPVQQAAYTLSNGFTYIELLRARGLDVNDFGPRLSFFLDCGLDIEYLVLPRVCRKIWAIAMRDVFGASERAQRFKLHTQTSGRSLIAADYKNNLTRTAIELMLSYINCTNSSHSNSADEAFTTPSQEYVRLAAHGQAILLEESGLFKHVMNLFVGSPGMIALESAVQEAILAEFDTIDRLGGVLPAMEHRYQRSQIQSAAHRYEQQIHSGERPVIGLNKYREESVEPNLPVVRTPRTKKQLQIKRLRAFRRRQTRYAEHALDALSHTIESGGNSFAQLIQTVEHCTLGQITRRLHALVGRYRPSV